MKTTLEHALSYVQRGWHVLPVKHPVGDNAEVGKRGKRPDGSAVPNGLKDASCDTGKIQQWFGNGTPRNIALRTGGAFDVLDIDGIEGQKALAALAAVYGDLPTTPCVSTGGGGFHYYFKRGDGVCNSTSKIGNKIDVRGTGGYAISPPSRHESGKDYVWIVGPETPLAEWPSWLLSRMNKPKQPAKTVTTSAQTSTPTIREGSRNGELTKLAGAMRRKGLEAPAIAAALQSHNQSHCLPPLPEKEVAAICRSIGRYPAEAPTDKMLCERFAWTDAGAGEMFAAVCGDKFRHVPGIGWLSYDGRRFNKKRGEKEARLAFVRCVARRLRDEALRVNHDLRESLEKYARRLEGSAKIDCALKEAACVAPIAAEVDDFDNDPWLFNCLNGVLNLKNDLFRDHTPEDNFMLVANVVYDPDAVCPLWDRFMDDTFQGDKEMIDLNYRWYGHCLTGDVTEQVLVIPYGEGGNGKNVQLDTTTGIMGDYGCEGAPDLLIATKGNKHTTEILDLLGKRLVVCSEPERDGELKMSLVKRLTGNKLLKGRAMHKDFVEFDRSHKMVLLTNNKPIVKEDSNAVWRRLRLVPYNYIVPEEKIDRQLTEKLVNEYSGILNRLVKGCLEWQRRGLAWPAEVMAATGSYRAEQNPFLGFVDESCVVGDGLAIPVCELHEHFRTWSRISGLSAEFFDINPRRFSQLVTDCGYVKKSARIHGGQVVKCWSGIGLRASDIEEDIIT